MNKDSFAFNLKSQELEGRASRGQDGRKDLGKKKEGRGESEGAGRTCMELGSRRASSG